MARRRGFRGFLVLVMLLAVYLLLWPVAIEPVAWQPPVAPEMAGAYAPNDRLAGIERLARDAGTGPEDVAIDSAGRIYGGMVDGRILRLGGDGTGPQLFAETGGRPLGLQFDAAGNLIVADANKGLLSVAPDGTVATLTREAAGLAFGFTDDVDVGADGTIYFSDASWKFGYGEHIPDLLEHGGNGRLLAYDPKSGDTRVLLADLQFANGVAVSPDQSFVLVVETGSYAIRRYWLTGPNAGQSDVFIDNLPGFPDGISSDGQGTFWLALYAPRNALADALAPYPLARKIVWRLPPALHPKPERYSFVLGLDTAGTVTHNLQDPSGGYAPITSVERHGDWLYLGSLSEPAIGRIRVPGL